MKITLLVVGKTNDAYLIEGVEKYAKRLIHYCKFQLIEIPELKNTKSLSEEQQKEKEAELILSKISNTDLVMLLDETGKQFSSIDFSKQINNWQNQSIGSVVFVVGGPYGFDQKINKDSYTEHIHNNTILDVMHHEKVSKGNTFYIPTGRVHAIGSGVLLAEIQQTSDITYRVYDWDRKDSEGNERELHNDIAIDAFDFDMKDDFRVGYEPVLSLSVGAAVLNILDTTYYEHLNFSYKNSNSLSGEIYEPGRNFTVYIKYRF